RSLFHQVCTIVDDYPSTLESYRRRGYEIACEFLLPTMSVAYVDTVADFGFFTELVGHTEAFVAHLTEVSEAARSWDGTDPVRRPTGDGYVLL
ncbi:MAG: glyoxalase/bleomycin resistance protein/dioxygenase, partial [Ilumatobacteraceae bacterium]|nr:glyoxalase/bleomycin resistance protein/dioxygenase [Ilumatobacteraceae bacterium]